MQIHAMAQIARQLQVLSAGNPRGIAMVYLSFDVAREQNEKVSGQEESLHGSITLGSLKSLIALSSLETLMTLKIFVLLFYLAAVVGDTFRADFFDDVAEEFDFR